MINPFRVIKCIDHLAYRLELLNNMRIYDVIFIVYLKFVIDPIENFYKRQRNFSFVVIIDSEKKYQVKRLIRKKRIRRDRE